MNTMTLEQMEAFVPQIKTDEELAKAAAVSYNKYWQTEDELYDFEYGTREHAGHVMIVEAWKNLYLTLMGQIADKMSDMDQDEAFDTFLEKQGLSKEGGFWVV